MVQYWGSRGAGVKFFHQVTHELSRRVDCELYVSGVKGMIDLPRGLNIRSVHECPSAFRNLKGVSLIFAALRAIVSFQRFLRGRDVSVVFCPMLGWATPILALMARSRGIPYILLVHDAVPHPGEDSLRNRVLVRLSILTASSCLVLSEHVLGQLLKIRPRVEALVARHGPIMPATIPLQRVRYDGEKGKRLLCIGRLKKYKGVEVFADVVIQLRTKGLLVSGTIAGEGDVSSQLNAKIKQYDFLELDNTWLSDERFWRYLFEADVVVVPYIEASQSGIIASALAACVPVVITPVGGLIEQIDADKTGVIAKSVSIGDIEEAVLRVINDDKFTEKIRRTQKKVLIENSDWSDMVDKIMHISERTMR